MDPNQPMRVAIALRDMNITTEQDPGSPPTVPATYLWTVLFKIDGDTVTLNPDLPFNLQGTATVSGPPGNQGDLGDTQVIGDVAIPPQIGDFRTVLQPIVPGGLAGQIGCLFILLAMNETPRAAVAQGYNALINALQTGLNNVIPTLGLAKKQPTQDDIKAIKQGITDAVSSAISANVSIWQFLASAGNEDFVVGTVLLTYSGNDLVNFPPAGSPFHSPMQY